MLERGHVVVRLKCDDPEDEDGEEWSNLKCAHGPRNVDTDEAISVSIE